MSELLVRLQLRDVEFEDKSRTHTQTHANGQDWLDEVGQWAYATCKQLANAEDDD